MESYRQKIESALLKIGDEKFQSIVRQIVFIKLGKTLESFSALGSSAKTGKTRKGTPDLYYKQANENFVFVEITTQETGLFATPKNPKGGKIFEDLVKCKERAKKGVKIEKIIYACLGKITPELNEKYSAFCKNFCTTHGRAFEIWEFDWFTLELAINFQNIVSDELGISPVYGAAQELDTAIKLNKFDVSQDHKFMHREDELKEVEEKLLSKNIVIMHGKPGCGKTRIAIEVARKFQSKKDFGVSYLFKNQSSKAIEDLGISDTGKKHVVILDDINRLPFWIDFINYVQLHKNIFIIATVREYAFDKIKNKLVQQHLADLVDHLEIKPLEGQKLRDVINSFVGNVKPGIVETILSVSKENARFAIMCAQIVKNKQIVPKSLEEILEEYFIEVNEDLKDLSETKQIVDRDMQLKREQEKQYKIVLAVVSVLQRAILSEGVNFRFQNKTAIQILCELGVDKETYLDAIEYWEQKELINIPFEDKVAEIADQILANYLFYKIVFVNKIVEFSTLFKSLYPAFSGRIVEMLSSLSPVKSFSELIKVEINLLWDETYSKPECNCSIVFIKNFWQLFPEKALTYMTNNFSKAAPEFVEILGGFVSTPYEKQALELLLCILEIFADNDKIVQQVHQSIKQYVFSIDAYENKFSTQVFLAEEIQKQLNGEKYKVYYPILYEMANELLDTRMETTRAYRNTICFTSVNVVPDDNLFKVRKLILSSVIDLLRSGKVSCADLTRALGHFGWNSPNKPTDKEMLGIMALDKQNVFDLIKDYKCKTMSEKIFLRLLLGRVCVSDDPEYLEYMDLLGKDDKYFAAYCIMHSRVPFPYPSGTGDYEKREQKKKQNWIKAFKYLGDYNSCIEFFAMIYEDNDIESYKMELQLNCFFEHAHVAWKKDYLTILSTFIVKCFSINFCPQFIMRKALELSSPAEIYKIIKDSNLTHKDAWSIHLFTQLKTEQITDEIYYDCLTIIEQRYMNCAAKTIYGSEHIQNFIAFENYKEGFFAEIFKKYLARLHVIADKKNLCTHFGFIESVYKDKHFTFDLSFQELEKHLNNDDKVIFYEVYFEMAKLGGSSVSCTDNFLQHVCEQNIEYLYKFYEIYLNERNDYLPKGPLVKFPNVAKNLFYIVKRHIENNGYIRNLTGYRGEGIFVDVSDEDFETFSRLFISEFKKEMADDEKEKKKSIFKSLPVIRWFFRWFFGRHKRKSRYVAKYFTSEIADLSRSKQIVFYKVAVEMLPIEAFSRLHIFCTPSVHSGSSIPYIQNEIETINQFLPLIADKSDYIAFINVVISRFLKLNK